MQARFHLGQMDVLQAMPSVLVHPMYLRRFYASNPTDRATHSPHDISAVSLGGESEVLLRLAVLAQLLRREAQQLLVRQLALVPLQARLRRRVGCRKQKNANDYGREGPGNSHLAYESWDIY